MMLTKKIIENIININSTFENGKKTLPENKWNKVVDSILESKEKYKKLINKRCYFYYHSSKHSYCTKQLIELLDYPNEVAIHVNGNKEEFIYATSKDPNLKSKYFKIYCNAAKGKEDVKIYIDDTPVMINGFKMYKLIV